MKRLAVLTLVAGCAASPSSARPLPPPSWTSVEEANGTIVAVEPDPMATTVSVALVFPTGTKDEPADHGGLAHLVEHTEFLQALPEGGSIASWLQDNAVSYNGHTSQAFTEYEADVLPQDLDAYLAVARHYFDDPCRTVAAARFALERDVVIDEGRQYDHAHDLATVTLPDAHPGEGTEAAVSGETLDDACAFARAHYATVGAVLVIGGAIDSDTGLAAARSMLERVVRRDAIDPAPAPSGGDAFHGEVVRASWDGTSDMIEVVYRLPEPVFDLGEALRMEQLLERAAEKVGGPTKVDGTPTAVIHSIYGAPIVEVSWRLAAGSSPPDQSLLDGLAVELHRYVQELAESPDTSSMEQRRSVVSEADLPSSKAVRWLAEALAEASPDRVRAAERSPLDDRDLAVRVRALTEPGTSRTILFTRGVAHDGVAIRQRDLLDENEVVDAVRETRATPLRPAPPALARYATTRRFTLGDGLRVILVATDADTPVITGAVRVGAGHLDAASDAERTADAAMHLYASTDLVAYRQISVGEGNSVTTFSDTTEHLSDVLDAAARLLRGPRLYALPLRLPITAEHRVLGTLTARLFGKDDLPASPLDPTMDDVDQFRHRFYRADNATLYVVGHFDLDAVEAAVRRQLDSGTPPGSSPPSHDATPATAPASTVAVVDEHLGDLVKMHVTFLEPANDSATWEIARVIPHVIRQRVRALRDKQGVSYGPAEQAVGFAGWLQPRIDVATSVTDAALAYHTVMALLDDLATAGPTDDEIERARTEALRMRQNEVGTPSSILWTLIHRDDLLGAAPGDLADDYAALRSVTAAQVRAYAATHLAASGRVTVVVGAKTSLDRFTADGGPAFAAVHW